MMYPTDFSFREKLKAFVDYEPVEALVPEARGALASIGIIKDVPFKPDVVTREALMRAVSEAPKMIYAQRIAGRSDDRDQYYADRQYLSIWPGLTANWDAPTYLDTDARAQFSSLPIRRLPLWQTTRSIRDRSIPLPCVTTMGEDSYGWSLV
jgi:hypothetical protein